LGETNLLFAVQFARTFLMEGLVSEAMGSCGSRWTRREVVGFLSAGAGLLSIAKSLPALHAIPPVDKDKRRVAFPKGAVIRTILHDMSPSALGTGPLLFHEHLSLHLAGLNETFTDDVDLIIDEVKAAGAEGVCCIVDAGHADMGRNLDALKRIATESKVPIVASGGYYMQRTYPADTAAKTADDIADLLVVEAKEQRWGALGEIGQQGGELTADEKKVFQAVAKVQARAGLPIFTHNAYLGARPGVPRDSALRQLDALESGGAKPEHIAIGHVCCLDDPKAEIASQLAQRGAFVGFDRVTIPIVQDAQKATTIMAMVEAGHADKILISSDYYSHLSLRKNGGGGIDQAVKVMTPMLLKAGMSDEMLHSILLDNPRRFLAFVPGKS
jgi:phosphotriesterase-related protein